tara:strand:- start:1249 stop:1449 length:201 start_codon:yes stop_codon:yes gene_type:complete
MRAKIEFEIEETGDTEIDKDKMINMIYNYMDEWIKGRGVIYIEFTDKYESNEEITGHYWITDSTIN